MKFLLDVNASRSVDAWLTDLGHDVVRVSDVDPRMPDDEILGWAVGQRRIILTTDLDFEEMIWREGRQENWLREYGPALKVPLCLGIGGTLDTIVGKVKRAPKIFQRLGLEWFYRLMCEPSRVGRQKVLPLFVWQVVTHKLFCRSRVHD